MSVVPTPAQEEPVRHHVLAWPSTRDGRRAGWLSLAPPVLSVVTGALGATVADEWSRTARIAVLLTPMVGMLLCSLVAGAFAVLALRNGHRSLVLLWPLLLGVGVVLFVIGEFAVPH